MFLLRDLAKWLLVACPDDHVQCAGISIDSRTCLPGQLFIAIDGERFDGHNYVQSAKQQGAVALCVSRPVQSDLPQLVVSDTTQALVSLAREYRQRWSKQVIAITGSYAKTSTKQMIASCLQAHTPNLSYSPGNWNNLFGLCLSILQVADKDDYVILEMGSNQPGDIATLTEIAKPDVSLITGIAAVHTEKLLSLNGVKKEKLSLFDHTAANQGMCVVNMMDQNIRQWFDQHKHRKVVTYGDQCGVNVWCDQVACDKQGVTFELHVQGQVQPVNIPLEGSMAIQNATAAAAVATTLGLNIYTITKGLNQMQPVRGRFFQMPGPHGAVVYDDSYNANPHALKSAIDYLTSQYQRVLVVLGDMLELGNDTEAIHHEVGKYLRQKKIQALWVTGSLGQFVLKGFQAGRSIEGPDEIVADIQSLAQKGDAIYIKGSRRSRLERVVKLLTQELA